MDSSIQFFYALSLAFETIVFSWFQERKISPLIPKCQELTSIISHSRESDNVFFRRIVERARRNTKKIAQLDILNKVSLFLAKAFTTLWVFMLLAGAWGWHIQNASKTTNTTLTINSCCIKIGDFLQSGWVCFAVFVFLIGQLIICIYINTKVGRIEKYTQDDAKDVNIFEEELKQLSNNYTRNQKAIESLDNFSSDESSSRPDEGKDHK